MVHVPTTVPAPRPNVAALWGNRELVSAPEVARTAGIPRGWVRVAVDSGAVPEATRGDNRGRPVMLTRQDALLIVAAAALVAVTGIALVTVIRLLRESGAQLGPDGLLIRLSGLGVTAA